jgi:multicomponent Na+:H+ antiporter subunit F
MLGVAALLVVYRFFKGPNIVDRVVALDLTITIGVATIVAYCIVTQQFSFLDDAMILALIAFLSTVAFSYYLTKNAKK